MIRFSWIVLFLSSGATAADPVRSIDFITEIRPLLARHCLACHGPEKQKGGLRLDVKADALKGGDSGAVIVSGRPKESLLYRLISGHDADRVMPPQGDRLTAEQQARIHDWISQGAAWPEDGHGADRRDWWSLKPITKPTVPSAGHTGNPIDAFVRAGLKAKGLTPSPEADRRTLIRRLSFDLTGLPPTFEDVEAFVRNPAADAYEQLVDKLLSSPRYGERWARHWLDMVHYGDTHGYDKDKPRSNAWPYRDYVIRAFNEDKPYGRFVQEQIAGDVLHPETMDGITALGFLAAGPWDLIGHAEVPETKIDGKIARHLDRDDMVATVMNTFASFTAQCAQCHNHKFDPITQKEYYQLQAVFAAIDRADRPYHSDPKVSRRVAELTLKRREIRERFAKRSAEIAARDSTSPKVDLMEAWDRAIAAKRQPSGAKAEFGYHSEISAKPDEIKWVQVDLGISRPVGRIVLWPCRDDFNGVGDGFGFPLRFKVEVADDAEFKLGVRCLVEHHSDVLPSGVKPHTVEVRDVNARFIRITATKLAPRKNDFIFALAELQVFDTPDGTGPNRAAGKIVTALDSIEAPVRWRKSNLVDGNAPGLGGDRIGSEWDKIREAIRAKATAAEAAEMETWLDEWHAIEREENAIRPTGNVYAGTVHTGSGAFRGTGPMGTPREIFVLKRGDVKSPDPSQRVVPAPPDLFREFRGTAEWSRRGMDFEGDRRAALATWLTDVRNPLTWRSIVNRVWQYHFGRGIVATPNDFGRMGQLPTHPELLDYLAVDFRDGGQSLKKLHKLIVTSATYRQSSNRHPSHEAIDAGNAWLWRANRRKLEAEAVRDSALFAAGQLNLTMGGPAFQDFTIERPEHSPHYQYHQFDPNNPSAYRRSVYRFLVRSKPQPFMTVLDCADPSMLVDTRVETLSPLQALALFNNGFMLAMARHLAQRVEHSGDNVAQVRAAFRLALAREPTKSESDALTAHARKHGLANACRVLLNLNEFVFVD